MAEANDNAGSVDALRAELRNLSAQVEKIVKTVDGKKDEATAELIDKVSRELEHIRSLASDRAGKIYDAGQAGLDEVGEHVRRNPLASLLVAFGAGCVISCLFRHLR